MMAKGRGALLTFRQDNLSRAFDRVRASTLPSVSAIPALKMFSSGQPAVSGKDVARVYGLLAHYTSRKYLRAIWAAGSIGHSLGCWLTPTAYAACLAPYNLGINSPRDVCLLVDVQTISWLWGPGTASGSKGFKGLWKGGAVEFFSPDPIEFRYVKNVYRILPCGDPHLP
jgi:hypothetical protein